MSNTSPAFEQLYRHYYGQLLAYIARLTGDLTQAEDLVQATFIKAMKRWPAKDYPDHCGAWLMKTARNAALDYLRHNNMRVAKLTDLATDEGLQPGDLTDPNSELHPALADDILRLMFTCCHPALHIDARVALCLNTICGLRTEEIARAFITSNATMSQRLWRAKSKIRDAGIRYQIPANHDLEPRLQAVLAAIYLIFNEGWLASSGQHRQRFELLSEAIRLGHLLSNALPNNPEAMALLALMVLQNSRRDARFTRDGELILLAKQDRSRWHTDEIQKATEWLHQIFQAGGGNNRYALMAAIAATHANSISAESTDWSEIALLYEALSEIDPSPVVALNHAVAIGERDGPQSGLQLMDQLAESAMMQRYHLFHASRAEFLRRLQRREAAVEAYQRAQEVCNNAAEQKFLRQRLRSLLRK